MPDELDNKRKWFLQYINNLELKSVVKECAIIEFYCPCCNYPTLPERGAYHICPLCFWEDDGQDEPYADEVWGGPNGYYSLTEARNNFASYLTGYRPADKAAFENNTLKNNLKKILMEKYDALKTVKDKISCEKLKKEINELKDQLF